MEKELGFFPLSHSQQNILNLEQAYTGLPVNNICTSLRIEGNFRADLLQQCIRYAYEAFPVLRMRITQKDGKICQYVSDEMPVPAPFIDFSRTNKEGVAIWNRSVAREHMPLFDSCLCQMTIFKLSENEGGILTRAHHIICDAWSQTLVTNHIIHNYFQLLQSKEPKNDLTPDYFGHVETEQGYMNSRSFLRDQQFWKESLKNLPVTQLREHRYAQVAPVGVRHSILLSNRMNRMIAAFCTSKKVSPFTAFYLGIAIYLYRMKKVERFCIGVPTINRLNFKEKNSGGMFVNTLPFVGNIDGNMSLNELNEKLRDDWFSLLYHQRIPFEEIKKIVISENEQIPEQLFGIVLSYQNGKMDHLRGARVTVEGRWIYSGYQAEALCIHVSSRDVQNQFLVDYDYLTQIFSQNDIEAFHEQLMQIIWSALQNPDVPVKYLDILSEDKKEQLIFEFNQTETWYQRDRSLKEELLDVAESYPNRAALIWEDRRITYRELAERAEFLGSRLGRLLGGKGKVAAILMERQEMTFQLMAAAAFSENTWITLDASLPAGRLEMMLEESGAAICICSPEMKEKLDGRKQDNCRIITVEELENAEELPDSVEETEEEETEEKEIPAYLVFTSGSTGKPKAVAVGARSLMNLASNMSGLYPKGAVLSLCNVAFDAFLLESMSALLCGRTIVIAREEDMNDGGALGGYINRYDVGFMALTPSRLQAYLKVPVFKKSMMHMECIVCGGENLPSELLQEIRDCCTASVYNQYGPSEATVAVSHKLVTGNERLTIGKPLGNCRIYILDDYGHPMTPGCAGEIYIGGECLSLGYYGDEELTNEKFVDDPFIPGEKMYRTGDMGEWTDSGEIIFLGRADRQMKLLGHRIEPGEVEECLGAFPGVIQAAVTVYENQLIAYYTAEHEVSPEELIAYGSEYLPRYMLPVFAQQMDAIPYTSGGKVDYKNLPKPEINDFTELPADSIEQKLAAIWKKILGKDEISVHSDYFLSGGDSLNAAAMLAEMEEVFGFMPKMEEFYRNSTIRRLGNLIRGGKPETEQTAYMKIERAPEIPVYPVSATQQSFYILEQLDEQKKSYHMAGAFEVAGDLDADRMNAALNRLATEEELFRTGFEAGTDGLISRVHEQIEVRLEQAAGERLEDVMEAFVRPFDLAVPPLFRTAVYKNAEKTYLLMDMHHIISDGISSVLTMKRLDAYYRGEQPKLPKFRYRDYAWTCRKTEEENRETENFWKKIAEEGIPELRMQADRPRQPVFDGSGRRLYFDIPDAMGREMQEFCGQQKLTAYAVLFSAYAVLLAGLSRQSRFAVGAPFSGRQHSEMQNMIGAFVNTLPIPVDIGEEDTIEEVLQKNSQMIMKIIDCQQMTLEEIMRLTGEQPRRDRNAIYTTLFSLTPLNPDEFRLGDATLKFVPGDMHAVKVDLHLEITPVEQGYRACFEYADSLFDEVTIAYYGRCYQQILKELVSAGMQTKINELQLVSPGDRMRLIEQPNYMRTPYEAACIDRMIERYAYWKADEKAVCWGEGQYYTYSELNRRAGQLAKKLAEKGVKKGDIVAMMPKRTGDMLVMMLGILKTGAAYLPVDAAFPQERISYMIENAGAVCMISEQDMTNLEGFDELPPVPGRTAEDVANVIYTSGSTGRPKGVMMVHKALANLLCHIDTLLGGEDDCILCASNCVFDVFTTETLIALGKGRRISVADEEEMMLPWKMAARMERDGATILQLTPSRIMMCLNDETFCRVLAQIRIIILLGEPWTLKLKERLKELTQAEIYNIYGPTETSVHNCQGEIRDASSIHIGKPLGNCRYYLLDEKRRPVMPTASGEIYIAGECLAKGYINRQDLTESVFVDDPFFAGEKMYRTGDLGRLRADGNWQCLGRDDNQLKLNGHRIEPEEIAAQMIESHLVKEAAVVPVIEDGIPQFLRAFAVPEEAYETEKLRQYLASVLPDYMVPSQIIELEKLPRTASGKTDLNVLKEYKEDKEERQEEVREDAAPETNESEEVTETLEETVYRIWSEVLKIKPDKEVSFFEQGGTSLKAILVLNQYYKYHLDMSLNTFYNTPVMRKQLELLGGVEEKKETVQNVSYKKIEGEGKPVDFKGKTVLLTGATGYLGAHLLREFLENGAARVVCVVRSADDHRLKQTLTGYFGEEFCRIYENRMETVSGDITKPQLGLSDTQYCHLMLRIQVIVHSAADVRHFAKEEELYLSNVTGTKTMLELAEKADIPFVHISTVSVAGEHLAEANGREALFTEECLDIGQNWQENNYAKTKFLAEELVWEHSSKRNVKVFRIGRLAARQMDGIFQKNPETNAYFRLVNGITELGMMPESMRRVPFELTPVDLAAKAVVMLLGSSARSFHIQNPKQHDLAEILQAAAGEKQMETVSDEVFDRKIREIVQNDVSEYIRAAAEVWIAGMGNRPDIQVSSELTEREMAGFGLFWEKPDLIQMSKCFEEGKAWKL